MRFSMLCRCSFLALVLTLSACGSDPDSGNADSASADDRAAEALTPRPDPAEPTLVDGVQVAEVEAGPMGYDPRALAFERGVPVRLVFTRTVESECSSQVAIPAFGVPVTDLPLNEPVAVEFTPTESGDFEFVCGMDMQRGTLVVQS